MDLVLEFRDGLPPVIHGLVYLEGVDSLELVDHRAIVGRDRLGQTLEDGVRLEVRRRGEARAQLRARPRPQMSTKGLALIN